MIANDVCATSDFVIKSTFNKRSIWLQPPNKYYLTMLILVTAQIIFYCDTSYFVRKKTVCYNKIDILLQRNIHAL